jgi:hypothetical protein
MLLPSLHLYGMLTFIATRVGYPSFVPRAGQQMVLQAVTRAWHTVALREVVAINYFIFRGLQCHRLLGCKSLFLWLIGGVRHDGLEMLI